MGFNSGFKGLKITGLHKYIYTTLYYTCRIQEEIDLRSLPYLYRQKYRQNLKNIFKEFDLISKDDAGSADDKESCCIGT